MINKLKKRKKCQVLVPDSRIILDKLIAHWLVKTFFAFYGIPNLMTSPTTARQAHDRRTYISVHFNIIFPSTYVSKCCLSFRFPNQNSMQFSSLLCVQPPRAHWFHYPSNNWELVRILKLLGM